MLRSILAAWMPVIVAIAPGPAPAMAPAADPQAQVMAAMTASAAGWNRGDLNAFMAVYADDATYVTGKGLVQGKAAIAARYRPSFTGGGNSRGTLSFTPLGARAISATHRLLWARWTLTPAGGAADSGVTTLLFERRPQGWRIISDHSS